MVAGVLVQPSERARRVTRVNTTLFGDPCAPAYPHHFDSADYQSLDPVRQ